LFEKRSIAERFPHLAELTAMNTFKLQFVAIGALFKTKAMFKRVVVATVTMFFQQWTGINAVLYYAPSIFGQLGLTGNTTSLLATGVVGIVMFLATSKFHTYTLASNSRTNSIQSLLYCTSIVSAVSLSSQSAQSAWAFHT
jgi:hypothetical protein